jgi:hypothetical protein
MPESIQEIVAEAFNLLWARIQTPRSACPDVELGLIEQEMTKILHALGAADGSAEEQWILAQLLLGPRGLRMLQWSWSEQQKPRFPAPEDPADFEIFFDEQADRVRLAYEAIARSADELVSTGRIQWIEVDGMKQLRIS